MEMYGTRLVSELGLAAVKDRRWHAVADGLPEAVGPYAAT